MNPKIMLLGLMVLDLTWI